MKRQIFIGLAIIIVAAALSWSQAPVKLVNGLGIERHVAATGSVYDTGITTLTNSAVAVTAATTYVQFIHCANIDSVARTVTISDNQGTPKVYFNAVSIPANGVMTANFSATGIAMSAGIKWNASANSAVNCQISGVQP